MTTPDDGQANSLAHDLINAATEEEQLRANLLERYANMQPRSRELLTEAAKLPPVIPEEDIPAWQDLGASIKAHSRSYDNFREVEKAPHIRANKVIENTFQQLMEPLDITLAKILAKLKVAVQAKKDRIAAEKLERARIEREAAEKAAAEKRRIEAEKRQKADEEERERQRIQREKEEAEKARLEAINREKYFDMLEIARLEAMSEDAEREAAKVRERLAEANRKATREKLEREARERDEAAAEMKRKQDEEAKQIEAKHHQLDHQHRRASFDDSLRLEDADRKVASAQRDAGKASKEAEKAVNKEATAVAIEEKIENADPLEFSRTRGDFGSMTSLSDRWTYTITDAAALDPAQIWPYIADEAKEKAIAVMVRAGVREIAGCSVYEEEKLNFRT